MSTVTKMPVVVIHTDGGCQPNPGIGGWAAILRFGDKVKELSGGEAESTNNRMELTAAIRSLETLKRPCIVDLWTDSEYVKNGITKWITAWKKNGWKRGRNKSEPVKNEDLWRILDEMSQRHTIRWQWLKGHAGHEDNERCDELCGLEIAKIRAFRS